MVEDDSKTSNLNDVTTTRSRGKADGNGSNVVLGHIHVSCCITAANRAMPVFEVLPQRNCVRIVNRPIDENSAFEGDGSRTRLEDRSISSDSEAQSAEWNFHSVFSSSLSSYAMDFFTEITLPALHSARNGINSNIVMWGVHPTQRFRLLFGKSVEDEDIAPQVETRSVHDIVDLYGQLTGLLYAFFSCLDLESGKAGAQQESTSWRLGISSWIVGNNQAIDLLTPSTQGLQSGSSTLSTLSFVSLETSTLTSAFHIVQRAKTNRIVHKQNTESVHFFVRLALFHNGQVSTVHLVDLAEHKDLRDPISVQEKREFDAILQSMTLPVLSPKQSSDPAVSCDVLRPVDSPGDMVLSKFMLPLFTANAKTFLYANVIDSRTSIRESVEMLNAVTSIRGFACVCQPLRGVSFEQLCFQSNLNEPERKHVPIHNGQRHAVSPRLESHQMSKAQRPGSAAGTNCTTEELDAMSWLDRFTQRKREILEGTIDSSPHATIARTSLADAKFFDDGAQSRELHHNSASSETQSSLANLHERLRETLLEINEIEPEIMASPPVAYDPAHSPTSQRFRSSSVHPFPAVNQVANQDDRVQPQYSRSTLADTLSPSSQRLTKGLSRMGKPDIECPEDVSLPKYRPCIQSHTSSPSSSITSNLSAYLEVASKAKSATLDVLEKAGLPACVMEIPSLDGLDTKTAQKIQAMDAKLLRKNYDALLSIVYEEQQGKQAAEARALEARHEQEEQRAIFEVQIENMKLANVGLRSRIRALENHSSLPQVFEQYEQQCQSLHAQVQALQAQNVALELQTSGGDGGLVKFNGSSLLDLKRKYKHVVEEKFRLEREVMEYQRKEKHLQIHSRLVSESTRRVEQLSRDLNSKKEDLVATQLSKQRLSAEMKRTLDQANALRHENEKLLREKEAMTEELVAVKKHLSAFENEQKKASILNRFVEKHGDSSKTVVHPHGHSSGTGKGESWRRDRACEGQLLAIIKRSHPQALPLYKKLLRRLELQEVSLQEYAEREVEYINLLVGLVTDQSSNSLKHMIKQEMKRL